jgi:hypothetical protein
MIRQNPPVFRVDGDKRAPRELPVGSELLIAFTLGAAGWWVILMTVRWLAS